jgi:hypothetical protein
VPKFDIGQLERVSEIFENEKPRKVPAMVLAVALEDARPKVDASEFSKLKCGIDELGVAVDAVLTFNGFKKVTGQSGPNASAPAEAPGIEL